MRNIIWLSLFMVLRVGGKAEAQVNDTTAFIYAYPTDETYPITGHHRDVLGKMFPVFGTGTLDTFYFQIGNVSSVSPQAKIRIFQSKVGPHRGPGFGPYASGCQNWGYYVNAVDPDQGITPFKDAATDTHWVSTIGGATPSYSPLGNEIWGFGGFLVTLIPNSINKVALDVLGSPLSVTGGDSIFVTMEIVSSGGHVDDPPNEFDATWVDQSIAPKEESESLIPTGIWKFHEHNVGTSFSDVPPIKGWRYLTGGVDSGGTLRPKKPFLRWWFVLHPTANVPPKIKTLSRVYNTLSTGSQTVHSEIFDLNGANPSSAGVASAWVKVTVDSGNITPVPVQVSMVHTGPGNIWQGTISGQPEGSMTSYWVEAVDSQGLFARTLPVTYQVLNMRTDSYFIDTTNAIPPSNGQVDIPTSSFFLPPGNYQDRPSATDNGTAGPFDLGGPFMFFGIPVPVDTVYRYAWIGVDGAIALTASPTDTQHINSNGFFGSLWNIPGQTRIIPNSGNWDTPKNFIAPLYKDLLLIDSLGTYGTIRYKGDSARFIVEWDSVKLKETTPIMSKTQPVSQPLSITDAARVKFSLILNLKEGTVEFHYKDLPLEPVEGFEHTLVGMQGEDPLNPTTIEVIPINNNGYPTELRPDSTLYLKFWPVIATPVESGWNLLSVGVIPQSPLKSFLYPDATSSAFIYQGSYVPKDSVTHGPGFWLKFNGASTAQVPGALIDPFDTLDISVVKGWNIIGSLSTPIPIDSITSTPPGLVTSGFFGYSGGYSPATVIEPGKGYWVKVDSPGILWLQSSGSTNAMSRIKIIPTNELPPAPPEHVSGRSRNIPGEYALLQNYPNPFNPLTSIRYNLPERVYVQVRIFNVLGEVVSTLVDGEQEAGEQSVEWHGLAFPSGVYFYCMRTGSYTETKKMLLIR